MGCFGWCSLVAMWHLSLFCHRVCWSICSRQMNAIFLILSRVKTGCSLNGMLMFEGAAALFVAFQLI
jgi:hypothetical protein